MKLRFTSAFALRLLAAQLLIAALSLITAAGVALIITGPRFERHMRQAHVDPAERTHLLNAFAESLGISLAVSIVAWIIVVSAVTWYFARSVRRALNTFAGAAGKVSAGDYSTRVPALNAGSEFESMRQAFNSMATTIEQTEATRVKMLSDLAHELRTPLATLMAYRDGLDDEVAEWNEQSSAVLSQQIARLNRLASEIGEVSRAEEGRIELLAEPISVASFLRREQQANANRFAEQNVRLDIIEPPSSVQIVADPAKLGQVIANLLNNALRHTPAGGTVLLSGARVGDQLVIKVIDDGEGIDAADLPHIFERFYRADKARAHSTQGTGIGLTISRAIALAHGGTLTAHSAGAGRGATFTLRLPLG